MSAAAADALEVLAPASTSVEFRGETLIIAPVPVGVIPQLVRLLRPVMQSMQIGADDVAGIDITPDLVMGLVADHSDALFSAAALCSGKAREQVEGADLAEFIELVLKVVEVNRDFFVQRIAPLLGGLLSRWSGAGPTPSSS